MSRIGQAILRRWHGMLNLERQSPAAWHQARFREESMELQEAKSALDKLSETSDVVFAISRAKYDGYPITDLPSPRKPFVFVAYLYMIGKYTSRWAFYRTTAWFANAAHPNDIREVVNPAKDSKIAAVAARHRVDELKFKQVARQLRRFWPFLP